MPGVSAAASLVNALATSCWKGVAARHSTRVRLKYSALNSASVKPVSSSRLNARCSSIQYPLAVDDLVVEREARGLQRFQIPPDGARRDTGLLREVVNPRAA